MQTLAIQTAGTEKQDQLEAMFEVIDDSFIDNHNIAEMNAYSYCSCCCYYN